jgi:hypothetical protein
MSLVSVFANVVFPLDLPRFLIEGANHAVARTNDKQVTHDRRRLSGRACRVFRRLEFQFAGGFPAMEEGKW